MIAALWGRRRNQPVRHDGSQRVGLGGSNAGFPAFTRLMISRAFSRLASILMRSHRPMVVHTCLPKGSRATVRKLFTPVGSTLT